ncbi:MAG: zinc-finger domain-containing protein [Sedimenticola sp.]|uniref:Zinc-finger domain-containing protein n=1 Tax=Sedimenticola thiotaurini TaxID=1543721 RepID=A0A558D0K9_9GAMM|nr:zinc-finger domain-containing protein [Sedimenticola sp.]TVT54518.1 MAG: zinc-finger domain-containing protein [Sedimenticola thiotaurini]MCW8921882.1 zinc-finger domain-containing protein [Sedimenticola sp.]MCW8947418.1 zinc-finger domain-containing protein [Sedimenticola sp.]MCW8950584.1 zinc-finger domain-containing protein [Sedimenticola sp.]
MTEPTTETDSIPPNLVKVKKSDLPLACPRETDSASELHPRVFLPLKNPGDTASCRYCRTRYQVEG